MALQSSDKPENHAQNRLEQVATNERTEGTQPLSLLDFQPVPKSQTDRKIEEALNGTGDKAKPMNIPSDIRQLAVVTSDSFSNHHGEMRMFERDSDGSPWHASGFKTKVNVGEKGMGWGAGGLIQRESVTNGETTQRVGGPVLSENAEGKPTCDAKGNAKCEGDGKTTAGLFRLGLSWGTADAGAWTTNDAPPGTTMPYLRIDADYRVVPPTEQPLVDDQRRSLNGKIIRELDPEKRTYERYENGSFVQGTLSPKALSELQAATSDPSSHYRWVHKDVKDSQGRPLSEMLVRLRSSDPQHPVLENPEAPSFLPGQNGTQLAFNSGAYDGINPETGEKFAGSLDKKATESIFNDSDYRFGDIPDRGHRLTVDSTGQPRYSDQADDYLYNHPVRIIDAKTGEYEHLDPATGASLGRGRMDPEAMHSLINEDEDMNDAFYRNTVNVLQNTKQQPKGGGAIFVHQQSYLRREANNPDDTLGCVSMSLENLRTFIATLDRQKNPSILISPLDELDTVRKALE